MAEFEAFIAQQEAKRRARRRLLGIILCFFIFAVLLMFVQQCENKESSVVSMPKPPKKVTSGLLQTTIPTPKKHVRKAFKHSKEGKQAWASELSLLVSRKKSIIQKCMRRTDTERIHWNFHYNPKTGQVEKGHIFDQNGRDLDIPCLEKILSGPFNLKKTRNRPDKVYEISLQLL